MAAAASQRRLLIDIAVSAGGLTPDLARALEAAAPYGQGWPKPRVAVGPVRLVQCRRIGRDDPQTHLRFIGAGPDGSRMEGVAFRVADEPLGQFLLSAGNRPLQLAGHVSLGSWQGREKAELLLDDAADAR